MVCSAAYLPSRCLSPCKRQPFNLSGLLAALSTVIILPFDDTVIAQGRILRDATTGFAVSIEAGCNGVKAAIVLIAGVVAFPASVKHKIIAIVAGFFFLQALNIVRIISLFYLGQWNSTVFKSFHLYLWPVLLMPTLAPVRLLFWQLRGSPLWEALAADIKRASTRA